MDPIVVISALIIQTNTDSSEEFLLVNKNGVWILPGGKIKTDENETEIGCLFRELKEELPKLKYIHRNTLGTFPGESPFDKKQIIVHVHILDYASSSSAVNPDCELGDSGWFTLEQTSSLNLSEVTRRALTSWNESQDK